MAMRVHDMTVFLALWLFLLGLVNVQANLGSYSLYAPKISPKLDKDLDALLEFHSEGLKDRSTCDRESQEVDALDIDFSHLESIKDLKPILSRVFQESESLIEKYRRLLVRRGITVVSLPHWLLGWKTYTLVSEISSVGSSQIEVELTTPTESSSSSSSSSSSKKECIKMKIIFQMDNTGAVDMMTQCSSIGNIPVDVTDRLQSIIRGHTKKVLRTEMLIQNARRKMISTQNKEAEMTRKKKKKLQLDMIINPDKYKTKSATVKNPKSIDKSSAYAPSVSSRDKPSSGRYTPSSATQSRRVISKSR